MEAVGEEEGREMASRGSGTFLNKLQAKCLVRHHHVDGNEVQIDLDSKWVPSIHSSQKCS